MKYKHILNGKLLFETNDASEFFSYLMDKETSQAKHSVLFNLLDKSNGYVCNMVSASRPKTLNGWIDAGANAYDEALLRWGNNA